MKNPIWKYAILTGALMALAVLVFNVILFLIGVNPFLKYAFMFLSIYALVLILSGLYYRRKELGGYMEGWRAVSFGLIANAVAGFLYAGLLYGFFALVPQAFERHQSELAQFVQVHVDDYKKANQEELTEEQRKTSKTLQEFNIQEVTPISVCTDSFIKMSGVGLFIVLLATLFIRKSPPASATTENSIQTEA